MDGCRAGPPKSSQVLTHAEGRDKPTHRWQLSVFGVDGKLGVKCNMDVPFRAVADVLDRAEYAGKVGCVIFPCEAGAIETVRKSRKIEAGALAGDIAVAIDHLDRS